MMEMERFIKRSTCYDHYDDETAKRVGYYVMFYEPDHFQEILTFIESLRKSIKEEWSQSRDQNKQQCFSDLVRSNHASMVNKVKKWKGEIYDTDTDERL